MAAEHGPGRPAQDTAGRPAAARLALAVLLAAVVTGVLVIAGRVHQPDYAASIFGQAGTGAGSPGSFRYSQSASSTCPAASVIAMLASQDLTASAPVPACPKMLAA